MIEVDGVAALADTYDALLVDVWGVLHEGEGVYPAARQCLARLAAAGKPVILVSNAARRLDALRAELDASGVTRNLYHDLVASGELTWRALAAGEIEFARGTNGYFFGPPRSRGLCEGLSLEWCEEPEQAAFVLTTGSPRGNPASAAAWDSWLERMATRRLPMICANPDQVAMRSGELGISAGAIARRYRDLVDVPVRFFGKPDPAVFEYASSRVPTGRGERLLVVGDGLITDIAGANAAGLDCLFITGGIHADECADSGVAAVAARYGVRPNWFCGELCW